MFQYIEALTLSLANKLPLEAFAFVASFIEEVLAPVPSMAVLLLTGSFASIQQRPLLALIPLVLIAAAGKTLGAILVYFISDKAGELTITKFGRFFGISNVDVEKLGQKMTGTSRDYVLLTIFRALPIIPSSVMSVGCGILRIRFRLFIISTLIGTVIRDSIFIYVGYTGAILVHSILTQSSLVEDWLQICFLVGIGGLLAYLYCKRKK